MSKKRTTNNGLPSIDQILAPQRKKSKRSQESGSSGRQGLSSGSQVPYSETQYPPGYSSSFPEQFPGQFPPQQQYSQPGYPHQQFPQHPFPSQEPFAPYPPQPTARLPSISAQFPPSMPPHPPGSPTKLPPFSSLPYAKELPPKPQKPGEYPLPGAPLRPGHYLGEEFSLGGMSEKDKMPKYRTKVVDFSKRIHPCPKCGFLFQQRGDMLKHMRTVHLGLRPFQCPFCQNKFGERGNLNKHIDSVHYKNRPHVCPMCGSRFASSDSLKRHKKTHLKKAGTVSGSSSRSGRSRK